jgi:hypothetical protein
MSNRIHRWLANQNFDITTTKAVTIGHGGHDDLAMVPLIPEYLPPFHRHSSPLPATRTLPPKVIHHQAISKFQGVLQHVNTEADLQSLNADLEAMMYVVFTITYLRLSCDEQ